MASRKLVRGELPRPPVDRRGLVWLGLASIGLPYFYSFLQFLLDDFFYEFSSALASGAITLGTPFLMNSVLPVRFMAAYAVALFCFMLVLCSTRGLPCPGRSWGHKARICI